MTSVISNTMKYVSQKGDVSEIAISIDIVNTQIYKLHTQRPWLRNGETRGESNDPEIVLILKAILDLFFKRPIVALRALFLSISVNAHVALF